MKYLGLPDFLRIAARLLRVEVEDVRRYVRLDRAQHALLPPTAHFAGGGCDTVASEAARLFGEQVLAGSMPEKNVQCAWLCMRRFLNMNDQAWIGGEEDGSAVSAFVARMRDGEEVTAELVGWLETHLQARPRQRPQPSRDDPDLFMHLSSAITSLPARVRSRLNGLVNAIDTEIGDFARVEGLAYGIGTFRPSVLPATASTNGPTILACTENRLFNADGFVIIGELGGSLGAGVDLAIALARLVPILFLQPRGQQLSPRTQALLKRHGACLRFYPQGETAETFARSHVRRWLKREARALADSGRHREMVAIRLISLFRALRAKRAELSTIEFARQVAKQRMSAEHADALLADIRQFELASLVQTIALAAALDVPVSVDLVDAPSQAPEPGRTVIQQNRLLQLSHQELDDLEQVAESDGYTAAQVVHMISCAQASIDDELAREPAAEMAQPVRVADRTLWTRARWRSLYKRFYR
jgi:hypothetical protein